MDVKEDDSDFQDYIEYNDLSNIKSIAIPPPTDYIEKCSHCGLSLAYVPEIQKYFLNHWEIKAKYPLIVYTYVIIIIIYYFSYPFRLYHDSIFGFTFIEIIFGFLCVFSYTRVIYDGPGYLPFYYPMNVKNDSGKPDFLSGLAVTQEQIEYCKSRHPIPRASFFRSVHRIVIRPDHFCDIEGTFIGKKNHKVFVLFTFWSIIAVVPLMVLMAMDFVYEVQNGASSMHILLLVALFLFSGFLVIFCGNALYKTVRNTSLNQTFFERLRGVTPMKRSLVENWEQICGPVSKWYCWLWPVAAFDIEKDEELVDGLSVERLL